MLTAPLIRHTQYSPKTVVAENTQNNEVSYQKAKNGQDKIFINIENIYGIVLTLNYAKSKSECIFFPIKSLKNSTLYFDVNQITNSMNTFFNMDVSRIIEINFQGILNLLDCVGGIDLPNSGRSVDNVFSTNITDDTTVHYYGIHLKKMIEQNKMCTAEALQKNAYLFAQITNTLVNRFNNSLYQKLLTTATLCNITKKDVVEFSVGQTFKLDCTVPSGFYLDDTYYFNN